MALLVGSALVALREFHQLSQKRLGQVLGMGQSALSKLEAGVSTVPDERLEQIREFFRVPATFFAQDLERSALAPTAFRKFSDVSQTEAKSIRALGSILNERLKVCFNLFGGNEASLPGPSEIVGDAWCGSIEDLASRVRAAWGLPEGPVHDLTGVVEAAGVIVVRVKIPSARIHGLSLTPEDSPPIILLSHDLEGGRQRFTLAHELGHLLLHRNGLHGKSEDLAEREANAFASAFLMDRDTILSEIDGLTTYWDFDKLKPRWRVSAQALIMRASDLGLLGATAKQRLYMFISRYGFRKAEPNPVDPEVGASHSRIWKSALEAVEGDIETLSRRAFCTPQEISDWIANKPLSGIPFAREGAQSAINDQ